MRPSVLVDPFAYREVSNHPVLYHIITRPGHGVLGYRDGWWALEQWSQLGDERFESPVAGADRIGSAPRAGPTHTKAVVLIEVRRVFDQPVTIAASAGAGGDR